MHTIREIEVNHRDDLVRQRLDMIDRWRSNDLNASWEKLAKAMDTIGQSKLGQEIWETYVGEHYMASLYFLHNPLSPLCHRYETSQLQE